MKKAMFAILLVVLSMSIFGALLTPNAKAAPENVKILSYSWYTYPDTAYGPGELIVVGEVQNVGSTVLDHVGIQGIAYTTDGQPQAESGRSAFVENMLPQQKAPFYMEFTYNNAYSGNMTWITMVDHVALFVAYANDTENRQYPGLEVVASTSYPDINANGRYTVTGFVKNNGNQTAGKFWVVTTFYNASGTVVAINYTDYLVPASLPPQGQVTFYATPMDYSQMSSQITSHSLIVQSQPPATDLSPTPSSSESPSSSPTASPSASEQPTQSSAPGQSSISPELVYAFVGAVLIVVIIVALLFLAKRRKQSPKQASKPKTVSAQRLNRCNNCGNVNPQGSEFCNKCGARMRE